MNESAGIGCGVGVRASSVLRREMTARGAWEIERTERATGRALGTERFTNTITAAGLDEILELITGLSANHFSQANMDLVVEDSGNTSQFSQNGADSISHLASGTSGTITWEWADETTNTYTVDEVIVSVGGLTFSNASPSYAGGNAKPANENWTYRYQLTLTVPVDMENAMDDILDLVIGASNDHMNQAASALRVDGTTGGTAPVYVGADSAVTVSSGTATWVWTVPAGTMTGTWNYVEVYGAYTPEVDFRNNTGTPTPPNDSFGTKGSSTAFTVTLEVAIS